MLQNMSKEPLERTIIIAKGNSSLGKFLLFHTDLPKQPPCKEEELDLVLIFGAVAKTIDVINVPAIFMVSHLACSLFFLK